MLEPLYTADEMRAAEERHPGYPGTAAELQERAGAAVAREAMRVFPRARSFGVLCGGGANGADGRVAARVLREAGRDATEADGPEGFDVVIDALLGTGVRGAPRPETAALIERVNASGAPVLAVDLPSGVDASTGEIAGAVVDAALTVTFHGRKVGLVVSPGPLPCRACGGRRHRPAAARDGRATRDGRCPAHDPAAGIARLEIHGRARCWSSAARREWSERRY